jgi:hypothetical protein
MICPKVSPSIYTESRIICLLFALLSFINTVSEINGGAYKSVLQITDRSRNYYVLYFQKDKKLILHKYVNPLNPEVTTRTTYCNIRKQCILYIECIFGFV